jgi:hypothetical protein
MAVVVEVGCMFVFICLLMFVYLFVVVFVIVVVAVFILYLLVGFLRILFPHTQRKAQAAAAVVPTAARTPRWDRWPGQTTRSRYGRWLRVFSLSLKGLFFFFFFFFFLLLLSLLLLLLLLLVCDYRFHCPSL